MNPPFTITRQVVEWNPDIDFHNPDGLTPEQVGEGYRLLLKSEVEGHKSKFADVWLDGSRSWCEVCCQGMQNNTYRVSLSTWPLPQPKRMVPLEMKDVAGRWVRKISSPSHIQQITELSGKEFQVFGKWTSYIMASKIMEITSDLDNERWHPMQKDEE